MDFYNANILPRVRRSRYHAPWLSVKIAWQIRKFGFCITIRFRASAVTVIPVTIELQRQLKQTTYVHYVELYNLQIEKKNCISLFSLNNFFAVSQFEKIWPALCVIQERGAVCRAEERSRESYTLALETVPCDGRQLFLLCTQCQGASTLRWMNYDYVFIPWSKHAKYQCILYGVSIHNIVVIILFRYGSLCRKENYFQYWCV